MALSTAGAVMTGTRNAYEVAFHGKQLKSAFFETALAFAATKGAIKAYKGVSRLVVRGVGVRKLSLVRNSKYERLVIHPNQNPYQFTSHVFDSKPTLWTAPNGTKQTYQIFKRNDIDWNMVRTSGIRDFRGKTNLEAAKAGHAPQLPDGSTATLHHIGQDSRGALVEASRRYHGIDKGKAHDAIHGVYGRNKPHPEFPVDHDIFKLETKQYWKERVKDVIK